MLAFFPEKGYNMDERHHRFDLEEMIDMTVRQEAYKWIDRLPEESVHALIQVMRRMTMNEHETLKPTVAETDGLTEKMRAFTRMQALRRETAKYDLSDAQRAAALDEKYGRFSVSGGAE